jgi:hypothetical protein
MGVEILDQGAEKNDNPFYWSPTEPHFTVWHTAPSAPFNRKNAMPMLSHQCPQVLTCNTNRQKLRLFPVLTVPTDGQSKSIFSCWYNISGSEL